MTELLLARTVIARRHAQLMREYEQVRSALSRLYAKSGPHAAEKRKPSYSATATRLPLTFATDRHLRRRLDELSRAYVQLAAGANARDAQWFERSAARCEAFRDSIPAHRLPRLFAVAGGVVGLAPKVVHIVSGLRWSDLGLANMSGHLLVPVGYLYFYLALFYLAIRRAVVAKRELFLGRVPDAAIEHSPTANVYRSENQLFAALGRRKTPIGHTLIAWDWSFAWLTVLTVWLLPLAGHFGYSSAYVIAVGIPTIVLYVTHFCVLLFWVPKWSRGNWR